MKKLFDITFSILLVVTGATSYAKPILANSASIIRWDQQLDQIKLRVQVLDKDKVPVQGLEEENFTIQTTNQDNKAVSLDSSQFKLTPPEKINVDKTYLIILLDMSGSMRHNDLSGQQKLQSATKGIEMFIQTVNKQKIPAEIAIIPFGSEGDSSCDYTYQVDEQIFENSFVSATSGKLESTLNQLAQVQVCATTNIYEPLAESVRYLGKKFPLQISDQGETAQQNLPRLGIILLSDGYDAYRSQESKRFSNLKETFQQYPHVKVFTMGYGQKLAELVAQIGCPISKKNLSVDKVRLNCKMRGNNINEFIVDEIRLKEISNSTGGISMFPKTAKELNDSLMTFIKALREYEITYQQPGADRGSQHQTHVVIKTDDIIKTKDKNITMGYFIHDLSLLQRMFIAVFLVFLGMIGFKSFSFYSHKLKEDYERYLQ